MTKKTKDIAVGSYVHLATWKPGEKLYSSWIEEYDEYKDQIKALVPEEIILSAGTYTLKITYPLSKAFIEKVEFGNPLTREQIVRWIVDAYHYIYNREDKTTSIMPEHISGMLNRVETDGDFGIWGHDLEDLDLHTIHVDENNVIEVGVDS